MSQIHNFIKKDYDHENQLFNELYRRKIENIALKFNIHPRDWNINELRFKNFDIVCNPNSGSHSNLDKSRDHEINHGISKKNNLLCDHLTHLTNIFSSDPLHKGFINNHHLMTFIKEKINEERSFYLKNQHSIKLHGASKVSEKNQSSNHVISSENPGQYNQNSTDNKEQYLQNSYVNSFIKKRKKDFTSDKSFNSKLPLSNITFSTINTESKDAIDDHMKRESKRISSGSLFIDSSSIIKHDQSLDTLHSHHLEIPIDSINSPSNSRKLVNHPMNINANYGSIQNDSDHTDDSRIIYICHFNQCDHPYDETNLLICLKCRKSFHSDCCMPPLSYELVSRYPWSCNECKVCESCNSNEDEETMLICDACDRSYHMQCLNPPFDKVPNGDWFCNGCGHCSCCRKVFRPEDAVNPQKFRIINNRRICLSCHKFFVSKVFSTSPPCPKTYQESNEVKKKYCCSCMKPISETEGAALCDTCGKHVHVKQPCTYRTKNNSRICSICQEINSSFHSS